MSDLNKLENNLEPITLSYVGDISYTIEPYATESGLNLVLEDVNYNPVSYNLSRDTMSVMTKSVNYDEVFNNIRDEKTSASSLAGTLSAMASNDYTDAELLSGVLVEDGFNNIIAFSDADGEEIRQTSAYSFNTTISYSSVFWKYDNKALVTDGNVSELTEDYYFYVSLVDESDCNIIKGGLSGDEYLMYDTTSPFASSGFRFDDLENATNDDVVNFLYSYNAESSRMLLIVPDEGIVGFGLNGNIDITAFSEPVTRPNFLGVINKNSLNQEEKIANSFVPYYGSKNTVAAIYPVDNAALVTHNYASTLEKNSNYVTLKNNVTYDGEYSLVNIDQNVNQRSYTSINTGIRGNTGYSNFMLNYNSGHYKYDFAPDSVTYFNIPYELRGYAQINVNDSKLIHNGAIGGNSPANSDKLYKKLYEYSDFRNTGINPNINNGQYLCTWLFFNPLHPSNSFWVDRYYNPDKATKLDALAATGDGSWEALSSFTSFADTNDSTGIYKEYYDEFDKALGVFDVDSRVTFEANSLYAYDRIGVKKSQAILDEKAALILTEVKDMEMDFENNKILITENTNSDEEFVFNIVLDNFHLDQFKGNKIFTNDNLSLTVDKNFTPYNIAVDGSYIRTYDFDHNEISSLNISSDVSNVIFTDDYNLMYVEDVAGRIHTVKNNEFISHISNALTGITVTDFKYKDGFIYFIDDVGSYYKINPELDSTATLINTSAGDNLLVFLGDDIKTAVGDVIDYSETEIYVLSSNAIYYDDITTPIISGDTIVDMVVDSGEIVYALKDDSIHKIDNTFIPELVASATISSDNTLVAVKQGRYIRNGEVIEYLDVVDSDESTLTTIHRFDKDLTLIEKKVVSIAGSLVGRNNMFNTKFLEKKLECEITLFDVFNYSQNNKISLTIPNDIIEEDNKCVLSIAFSNRFGSINIYCNGNLIDLYKFDNNEYRFSNTLRDNKLFVGASIFNGEKSIDNMVTDSNNDMISGNYTITMLSVYDSIFNYYDVINLNRIYRDVTPNALILPIKNRSYIEEIAGFYNQNKHIRKSEYGAIKIRGTELTDAQKVDVSDKIDQVFEDTFINLRINTTEFE